MIEPTDDELKAIMSMKRDNPAVDKFMEWIDRTVEHYSTQLRAVNLGTLEGNARGSRLQGALGELDVLKACFRDTEQMLHDKIQKSAEKALDTDTF